MAIKSREEILNAIKGIIGERTDDESMSILEDVQDTFTDFETRTRDTTDWQKKYNDLDAEWRKKYRDRFFSHSDEEPEEEEPDFEEEKPLTFDSLFTTKE